MAFRYLFILFLVLGALSATLLPLNTDHARSIGRRMLQSLSAWLPGGGGKPNAPVQLGMGSVNFFVSAPPRGSGDAVLGRLMGSKSPTSYIAWIYTRDLGGGWWGPKASAPFSSSGSLVVTGWATDPSDLFTSDALAVAITLAAFTPRTVRGEGLGESAPPGVLPAALLVAVVPRGEVVAVSGPDSLPWQPPSKPSAPPPVVAPPPPPPEAPEPTPQPVTLLVRAPPVGDGGDILALAQHTLQDPSSLVLVVYVQDGWAGWWGPAGAAPLSPAGGARVTGWATSPTWLSAPTLAAFLMPAAAALPQLTGGMLPPTLQSAAAAMAFVSRWAPQPELPQPTRAWVPPSPASAPSPQPPNAPPAWPVGGGGQRTAAAGGRIAWQGLNWVVKDSGGSAVGPGPNVFVGG